MHLSGKLKFSTLALVGFVLFLSACQVSSGRYKKFNLTCSDIPKFNSEMNWELWGQFKTIKKCTGGTAFLEQYDLQNAYITYQGLSDIDSYFPLTTERDFREALPKQNAFKSNWEKAQIYTISTNTRDVMYSTYKYARRNTYCAYFRMGHGNYMDLSGGALGWNEVAHGVVCGSRNMAEAEFKKDFESRIQVFNVRSTKGVKDTAGFTPWLAR